jgi:peptidoglycan/LPS O-acetylase OafA/YrhL
MEKNRLPSLDGLRAVSIALVVVCHVVRALAEGRKLPYGAGMLRDWGSVGVTMFFAISGFLITTLLVAEQRDRGVISLRAFYFRRAFRILPAYWTYLAVAAALTMAGAFAVSAAGFATALSFTSDYRNAGSSILGHSWSLSVEEQFYLLWPITLVALGPGRARVLSFALVGAAPAARALTYVLDPALRPAISGMLHTRVDALMIGCWAALERGTGRRSEALAFLGRGDVAAAGAVVAVVVSPLLRHVLGDFFGVAVAYSLEALGACCVVLWAVDHRASFAGRVLNSAPLHRVGVLSYSLYLWQQPWLLPDWHWTPAGIALAVAGAYACAALSYRWVEAPFLQLRARIQAASRQRSPALRAPTAA